MWPLISNNQSLLCFLWPDQLPAVSHRVSTTWAGSASLTLDNLLLVCRVCLRIVHFNIRTNNIFPHADHTITEKCSKFKLKLKKKKQIKVRNTFLHSRLPLKMWVFNLPHHSTVINCAVKMNMKHLFKLSCWWQWHLISSLCIFMAYFKTPPQGEP